MRQELSRFQCGDMLVRYLEEDGIVGLEMIPFDMEDMLVDKHCHIEPLVQLKLLGDAYPGGFSQGRTMRDSFSTRTMRYVSQSVEKRKDFLQVITSFDTERNVSIRHRLRYIAGSKAVETGVAVCNHSAVRQTLEMLSSFTLGSLTPFDAEDAPERMILHRLRSSWSAEGRLCAEQIEALGLERSWAGGSANALRFGQVGSMPVRDYVPEYALEDTAVRVVWAVQLTQGSSWQLEACRKDDGLSLSGGLADREFGHWMKNLEKDETFCTPEAFLTVVRGDRDTAFQRLTEQVRKRLHVPAREKDLPVLFNEYCTTWGRPSAKRIAELAQALQGHGMDTLVIDAGWYADDGVDWSRSIGDWQPSRMMFPEGLEETVAQIRKCGMHAGLWFEFENCAPLASLYQKTDWFLQRDQVPICSGERRFLDLRREDVRAYLRERVISFVRRAGIEYVKVDYNECLGMGADGTESLGETLRQQIEAVQQFFDELRAAVPELVLEVCSSGGHRLVPSFMQRCAMASFSDAHECIEIPIIAANMHRMILPRQSQIWAVLKPEMDSAKLRLRLVSAMLGRMCLSGSVEQLTKAQWAVVDEGIAFYRKAAPIIDCGKSVFLTPPILSYRHPQGVQAVCRYLPDGQALLIVHTFAACTERITLPFQYVESVYAEKRVSVQTANGTLTLSGLQPFDGVALLGKVSPDFDQMPSLPSDLYKA